MRVLFFAAAAVAVVYAPFAAAAEKLNVKPGLWEITSSTQMSGMPPLPKELLDGLTAEQREEMQAALKGVSGQPQMDVARECITERDLEKPFESANPEECTQEIVRTTSTTQELRLVCTGDPKGSGTFLISTPTPETMSGILDMKLGEGSESMTIKASIKGRWLDADCGDEAEDDGEDYTDEEDEDF